MQQKKTLGNLESISQLRPARNWNWLLNFNVRLDLILIVIGFGFTMLSFTPHAVAFPLCESWAKPTVSGSTDQKMLDEESGLAYSHKFKRLYHINDSGDGPFFYVTKMDGGQTQKISIQNFTPRDQEDLAIGNCGKTSTGSSRTCLVVADIGDNAVLRRSIQVAFFEEKQNFKSVERPLAVVHLAYPDGPHNAEATALHPITGDLIIVTKEERGGKAYPAKIFKLKQSTIAAQLNKSTSSPTQPILLQAMGELDVPTLIKGTGYDGIVTAMDISPDGENTILLTYGNALELKLDFSLARKTKSTWVVGEDYQIVPLTALQQQESITYLEDGRSFLYGSEVGKFPSSQDTPLMMMRCEASLSAKAPPIKKTGSPRPFTAMSGKKFSS